MFGITHAEREMNVTKMIGFDAAGIAKAKKRGAEKSRRRPVALTYLPKADTLNVMMPSGTIVVIPRMWIAEIAHFPKATMKKIYLNKWRDAFHIDEHDIQISALGLLRHAVMGEDPYAKAGSATSPAKARAARRNGARGGRPKKKRVSR